MSVNSYPIHPDFKKLELMKLPSDISLYPIFNFLLNERMKKERSNKLIRVRRKTINGYRGTKVNLLIYEPYTLPSNAPCLVYYHGGGMILKPSSHHFYAARSYALAAQCKVILVDYSLVPEVIFPYPVEECYKAYIWTVKNSLNLSIDPDRIAVGGDSAGGALAAAVTLMARDRHAPVPCFQMLMYPATDRRMNTDSMKKYYNTPVMHSGLVKLIWQLYTPLGVKEHREYASPLEAESLDGLPDAYIETAEFDCLRDEGIQYAERLKEAGADVLLYNTKGTPHAFDIVSDSRITRKCFRIRTSQLIKAFEKNKEKD